MAIGKRHVLVIDRMGQRGDGVGRMPDGRLAFIAGVLPGERVTVEVTEEHKNFVRGVVVDWLHRADDRVEPVCPLFGVCGGCVFQHWEYASELTYKQGRVHRALTSVGFDTGVVMSIRPSRDPYGYRNKGQFPFGGSPGHTVLGLYRQGTHDVVDARHCAIQDQWVNHVLQTAQAIVNELGLSPYDETDGSGILRHLLIRSSRLQGQSLVLIVAAHDHPQLLELAQRLSQHVPEVMGVGLNLNPSRGNRILGANTRILVGSSHILETILGATFRLSMASFFQVNPDQTAVLYEAALACLPRHMHQVWDLYSGVGTLATLAARRADIVRALEVNPDAVIDAQVNFALNRVDNVQIDQGRVEEQMVNWVQKGGAPPDAVIVDPPRAGLTDRVVAALLKLRPAWIAYISCNPETWARDLALLAPAYRLQEAVPVDMFPRTDHVEVASCLMLNES